MNWIKTFLIFTSFLLLIDCPLGAKEFIPLTYVSPDKGVQILLEPLGSNKGEKSINKDDLWDCLVVVQNSKGKMLANFNATRKANYYRGHGLRYGKWTSDSRYFVFTTFTTEGHFCHSFPIRVYDRKANKFFLLREKDEAPTDPIFNLQDSDQITITKLDRKNSWKNGNKWASTSETFLIEPPHERGS